MFEKAAGSISPVTVHTVEMLPSLSDTMFILFPPVSPPLQDKDFGKQSLFQAHSNPAAAVNSSMKHYQQHSLERLYKGSDFMWALTPVQGDYILFSFPRPIRIAGSVVF